MIKYKNYGRLKNKMPDEKTYSESERIAKEGLRGLSLEELREYRDAVRVIASRYYVVDETMRYLSSKGKLSLIEQMLRER